MYTLNTVVHSSKTQAIYICGFISECILNILMHVNVYMFVYELRHKTTQPSGDGFEDLDKPIKFTTSKAAAWKAVSTHGGFVDEDMPWFQPYVVSFSTAIFLLYFLALREENDIDEQMKTPLWEKIPGLEKQQLEVVLQYNKDHGLPTKDVENRLMQIDKDEKAALQKSKAM